jgi:hypothetical protein
MFSTTLLADDPVFVGELFDLAAGRGMMDRDVIRCEPGC